MKFFKKLRKFIKKYNLKPITLTVYGHTPRLLFESGIQPKEISDRLGHNNIQTTFDLYTHINDNQRFSVVEKFVNFYVVVNFVFNPLKPLRL